MSAHLKVIVSNGSCPDSDKSTALVSRSRELDRYRMQVIAAEIWSNWLHAEFRRPEDVASFFGVRNSTAWNWWNATSRPTADKVMIAVLEDPGFVAWLTSAVAADADDRRAA